MLRLTTLAPALALITVLAAPTAAFAATDAPSCSGTGSTYASSAPVTSDVPVVAPSQTVTVTWADGYFAPGAPVTVSTSGPAASGSRVVTADSTGAGSASAVTDADGGLIASVTLASTATGSISVQAWSDTGCGGVTVGVATPAAAESNSLAYTGGSVPTVLVVAGAGAIAFGGILLAARLRSRRRA